MLKIKNNSFWRSSALFYKVDTQKERLSNYQEYLREPNLYKKNKAQ